MNELSVQQHWAVKLEEENESLKTYVKKRKSFIIFFPLHADTVTITIPNSFYA